MSSHEEVAKAFMRCDSLTGSRMFSEGDTIYSYGHHFPIAKHTAWGFIFNKNGYSVSTAKHKGIVLRAIGSSEIIELIDCNENKAEETFRRNMAEMENLILKKERARTRKDFYNSQIEELLEQQSRIKDRYLKAKAIEML